MVEIKAWVVTKTLNILTTVSINESISNLNRVKTSIPIEIASDNNSYKF